MAEPILSYELKSLLTKIKSDLSNTYPIQVITPNYLILSILENKSCEGYNVISRVMMNSAIEDFRIYILDRIQKDCLGSPKVAGESVFSDIYENLAIVITNNGVSVVNSAYMLVEIVTGDADIMKYLASNGVTRDQLVEALTEQVTVNQNTEKGKAKKSRRKASKIVKPDVSNETTVGNRIIPEENNIVESSCTNMVRLASKGVYANIIGYDKEIQTIFDVLGKYDRNTVAIVGEHGVGKTSLIQRLANALYYQQCPKPFRDKYLIKFEDQISSLIIDEMNKQGRYIAFIDDVERLFANKEAEANNIFVLTELFKASNICTVFTANDSAYAKIIESKPEFARYIHKIKIEEPEDELLEKIVKSTSKRYGDYNSVEFSDINIKDSIRLAKRFITLEKCPQSAINILDATASYVRMREPESSEIMELRTKLAKVDNEISLIQNSGSSDDFDRKDSLIREQIQINKKLSSLEKADSAIIKVTENDIKSAVSEMTSIPITEMDEDERNKLKRLKDNLTSVVIGQDDAINNICKAVKRQRVGLSNPNKPVVMLFVGTTGTGKSFLAKRLAYEMFGDEKNMVRLDMSEYSEKTSVTKLYGTAPGYIGYEEGGILTEAIKKKSRCVLLLDEIEKAHEDVYNVLLQVFDEGRLTDNKGNLIDFKNTIIIMTSNIGAREVTDKVARIGFGHKDENAEDKDIILKSIKKAFKPEFINRIDNICYFNKLTDDNLRQIIVNEIGKVRKKVVDLGYDMDDDLLTGKMVDDIFAKVKEESEYGARPILREIQSQLEDKLTDYIIDNNIEKGFIFKYDNIYNK